MLRRALQTTSGRVVLLLSAVAVVWVGSAALAHFALGEYDDFGASLWSATLHVLDPSSLHGDEGAGQRAIGVFQVITGLVLIVGLLFTFVAEVLGSSLEQLGQSDRPLHTSGHLVIVGGADLVPVAARALAEGARLDPGLDRFAVLAPESARESHAQIRSALREAAGGARFSLIFGDTAGDSGFEAVAAERAKAILLLPSTSGTVAAETADVETTQSGLALLEYLKGRDADPLVRVLFRRGRNVDATWSLFPEGWDAIVGDRTVSGLVRLALTHPESLGLLPTIDEEVSAAWGRRVHDAWSTAGAGNRPLRLAMVGSGVNARAVMEDLAELGRGRVEVTVIAAREAVETYLGEPDPNGPAVRIVEASQTDPRALQKRLDEARPDFVLVSPSPLTRDLRLSDANATLATLHVLQAVGEEVPVFSELFLPESANRLPEDPRLLAISGLRAIAIAVALSIFDAPRAAALQEQLASDAAEVADD